TLLDSALTWWNSHKRTIGTDAAYALSWRELMKLMIEVFQELTMMCTKMVPKEEDRVEKFIGGLPDNIQGNVIAAKPTRLQDDVRIANNLMDKKLNGYAVRNAENKRRFDTNHRDNRGSVMAVTTQGTPRKNQKVVTCFECGAQGHYRKNCPKIKNQNCGNKARVPNARGKAYVLVGGDANPGSNTVTDVSYAVELADERTSETSIVLRRCTLGLLGHPFNIDPMPIDLGRFDIIIGDKSDEKRSMLSIISCVKAHKYMEKGCQLFLAQVTMKENKDKLEEKQLEDVPTVQDFLKFFSEDLPGLPLIRQVEFQIDLV
nr:hypothetical protein [Tanacetum cinerariifolium]